MIEEYVKLITEKPEYFGFDKLCNICGFRFSKFANFGMPPREAQCPVCKSLERHRHLYVHLSSLFPFIEGKEILHFAPEFIIKELLVNSGANYYDADIDPNRASNEIDITNIKFDDEKFDYIICVHVLEHIVDDIKAMKELYRVLRPGGIAFISVPLRIEFMEDLSITSSEVRTKLYGQHDHVRCYSLPVLLERLSFAGFKVEKISDPKKMPKHFKSASMGDMIIHATKE